MADGDDVADHIDEGRVELGIVEEVGMRIGEVGEDTTHREGCGQGEARNASARAELEEMERATRGRVGARMWRRDVSRGWSTC
jgi:hypothetical protein